MCLLSTFITVSSLRFFNIDPLREKKGFLSNITLTELEALRCDIDFLCVNRKFTKPHYNISVTKFFLTCQSRFYFSSA